MHFAYLVLQNKRHSTPLSECLIDLDTSYLTFVSTCLDMGPGPHELRLVVHRGVLPDINNIYGEGYDYINVPTWENARVSIHAPDEIPQMNGGSSFALIRGQDHIARVEQQSHMRKWVRRVFCSNHFHYNFRTTQLCRSESLKSSGFGSRHCVLDSDKEEDLRPYWVSKYGLKRYTALGCLLGCRATKVSEICNLPFPLFPLYEGVRPGPDTLEDLKAGHLCLNANRRYWADEGNCGLTRNSGASLHLEISLDASETEMLAFMGEELREKCECPPACQETQYDLEVRESPLDSHKEVFNDLETSNPRFMTFENLLQDARFIQSASLIKMINQRYDRLKEDLAIIHIAMEPTKMEKLIRRKVLTLWEVLGR
ncbi:uncharacterized protein LOC131880540 isoform X1 [Tigriopus californicus]|uniref:uncharacterized protein LOC131880540 isoform X1 n=1 Tax=Tigriopus californicus TaxID=6832 RepID=UPI0027DA04EC|nr:uncharacterized protein LOC131880540 isoform X1 [Tigriopus californicus]